MDMIHAWFLGYAQKFVDFAARHGLNLFFLVNLSLVLHVFALSLLWSITNHPSFYLFGVGSSIVFIGWARDKPCIKAGAANHRKVNVGISHCFLIDLTLGLFPSPMSIYFLTAATFLIISQCDYVEPQVPEHQQEQSFAA